MYLMEDQHGVCSRLHLMSLPGKVPTAQDSLLMQGAMIPYETFVEQLRKLFTNWDRGVEKTFNEHKARFPNYDMLQKGPWEWWNAKFIPKMAVVEAVTCSGQPEVEEYLRKLGFQEVGPFKKLKHKVTTITVWIAHAPELCERVGYVCEYDTRTEEERKAYVSVG